MPDVLFSDAESSVVVSNNEKEHRYEISVAGETAGHMGYRVIGNRRVLMHTVIYDAFRGQGLSNVLIKSTLDFFAHPRKHHLKLLPGRRRVHTQESRIRQPGRRETFRHLGLA
ncbi:GNAT family N-acetyltransferase [Actinacidiphila glaucinigra]|uniref:GNAT family N-acetyltransferase n=1 Tax=Actinacidiphila glaucinigra TaxID=235986 RepID=UPI0035D817D9